MTQQQSSSESHSKSRSNTPPSRKTNNRYPREDEHQNHVEFSPICSGSSGARRGSTASGGSLGHSGGLYSPHGKLQNKDSVDREKQRRLEKVARAKERREAMLKRVRREKKTMLFSSILAFLALFVWFVAVFTDHWFHVVQSEKVLQNTFNSTSGMFGDEGMSVFIRSNTGLWKTCVYFQHLKTLSKRVECSYFSIFLTLREEANKESPNTMNEHVIEYTRAQICFASISVLLMTMTILAAFYTFKNSRYVYKRFASCLYFMTTISVLVVLEVLVTSVYYAAEHNLYPDGAIVKYGFSFYMGWSVFLVYLVNGCIFLILSRKHKYDKEDDSDGGFITGR